MDGWICSIEDCEDAFDRLEGLLVHQLRSHDHITCKICSEPMPDGYPALEHVVDDHTRAEYVRAYAAGPDDIRIREEIVDYIATNADFDEIDTRLSE